MRLCPVLGAPERAEDDCFADNAGRVVHRDDLVARIAAILETRTSAAWLEALEEVGVPAGPINSIDQVFADPHIEHRGMAIELPHPVAGTVPLVGSPINLSRTPVAYQRPPPGLGEHTAEVLREKLGLSDEGSYSLQGRDRGAPAVGRSPRRCGPLVRCRERINTRVVPIRSELL